MDMVIIEDVKNYLNIQGNDSDYLLSNLISAASKFIENYCQKEFSIKEINDRFDGTDCDYHVLFKYPANRIIEVKINETVLTDYEFDNDIVYLNKGCFYGKCFVKYETGFTQEQMPADLKQACIELVSFWYKKKDVVDLASKNMSSQTTTFINKEMPDFIKVKLYNYEAKF